MTIDYPESRTEDAQDVLAGVSFPDPYRWLEKEDNEVRQWQRAQARLASDHVREWPWYSQLRELVERFNLERVVSLPRYAAGRWFRMHAQDGASHAVVVVADDVNGEGRVLFDPRVENAARPPFLSWIAPSPDGLTLAVGVCADGSESNTIRLIDVQSGCPLPDPPRQTLMDSWTGGVQWLRDSSGFFFTGITGDAIQFAQQVHLHRRVPTPSTVSVNIPWTQAKDYRMVVVSRDGRYAIAVERLINPIPIAFAAIEPADLCWRPFVTSIDGTLAGYLIGDRYVAITDVGAPRGRVVSVPLGTNDPNNPESWTELVPESEATLRTLTQVGDILYLTEYVDTYARVRIIDSNGREVGRVPLPGQGAIVSESLNRMMNLVPQGHPDQFLFGFSSLTVSPGIFGHVPGSVAAEVIREPKERLEDAIVEDRWAGSSDGTRVPYHVVRRADVDAGRPQPTLIYAYGGFNIVLAPQFPGAMAAFVAAGGVLVHAHLRGGGEFGLEWWRGGALGNKQNGYQDLYAIAEDLIARNRTSPELLAVTGNSNGGLMAGVAATQRPELWKAVIPRVPLLDCIGACRDPYARWAVTTEMADATDPREVRRLATFSPYHLVRDGVRYPAVFIDAGDTDPRCPPWHARKFAARMQKASSGEAPILVHIWENAGHGWATDKSTTIAEHTEWLAFTMRHLGMLPLISTTPQ